MRFFFLLLFNVLSTDQELEMKNCNCKKGKTFLLVNDNLQKLLEEFKGASWIIHASIFFNDSIFRHLEQAELGSFVKIQQCVLTLAVPAKGPIWIY